MQPVTLHNIHYTKLFPGFQRDFPLGHPTPVTTCTWGTGRSKRSVSMLWRPPGRSGQGYPLLFHPGRLARCGMRDAVVLWDVAVPARRTPARTGSARTGGCGTGPVSGFPVRRGQDCPSRNLFTRCLPAETSPVLNNRICFHRFCWNDGMGQDGNTGYGVSNAHKRHSLERRIHGTVAGCGRPGQKSAVRWDFHIHISDKFIIISAIQFRFEYPQPIRHDWLLFQI